MLEGYKAVYEPRPGVYLSVMGWWGAPVWYYVGEASTLPPGGGPLCVFQTLEDAQRFVDWMAPGDQHILVFLCDYEPSSERMVWSLGNPIRRVPIEQLPHGTVLARSVTLCQCVWPTPEGDAANEEKTDDR